jgi:hypothetical protein
MKSNSALPGGSLKSKPTWGNISKCSPTSAFCAFGGRIRVARSREDADGQLRVELGAMPSRERPRPCVFHLAHLGSGEEHVALLVDLRRFGLLQRWDDLLDDGVAAVFGLASGEAELLALFFHAGKFAPARAATWLPERGFKPLHFVPNSGRLAAADFDAPVAALIGRAVSGNGTRGEWRW